MDVELCEGVFVGGTKMHSFVKVLYDFQENVNHKNKVRIKVI